MALVERVLHRLAELYDDGTVKVDTSVFNPARIWKVYGTPACKGDDTAERPHRMASLIAPESTPDTLHPLTRDQLERFAPATDNARATPPPGSRANPGSRTRNGQAFDVAGFIQRHDLDVTAPDDYQGGQRWVFNTDPMGHGHDDGSAYLIQFQNGAIAAGCHHDSATWTWADLRAKYDPRKERQPNDSTTTPPANGTPRPVPRSAPVLIRMADVEPTAVRWLWPGRIPRGRMTLLVGRPGGGKSFLTADLEPVRYFTRSERCAWRA